MKKDIDQSLLNLFTKDYQPFKIVKDIGFKDFVKMLNPSYTLLNRHSIPKEHIPALYAKMQERNERTSIKRSSTYLFNY